MVTQYRSVFYLVSFYFFGIELVESCLLNFPLPADVDIIFVSSQKQKAALDTCCTQYKVAQVTNLKPWESQVNFASQEVTFIVIASNIKETLTGIEAIGNLTHDIKRSVVIWPFALNASEVNKIWEDLSFQKAMSRFQINSRLLLVLSINNDTNLIYHLYKINNSIARHEITSGGHWDVMNCGICCTPTELMNGYKYPITVQDAMERENGSSLVMPLRSVATGSYVQRYLHALFTTIANTWNFTLGFVKSRQNEFQLDDGSWQGVVPDIENGIADIGMSIGFMRKSKAKHVAYLPPLGEDFISAFFIQPNQNVIRDIFVEPFQRSLWIGALVTWLLLAVSMSLISILRQKFCVEKTVETEVDQSGDSFLMMLGTATQQGWDQHPVATSLRTILILASIMGVIIYAGYSAAIVSTLSIKRVPITTPDELLASHLRVGVRDDFSKRDWDFQTNDTDHYAALMNRISNRYGEGFVTGSKAVYLIQTEPYAYVTSHVRMFESCREKLTTERICDITEMPVLTERFQYGMFTRKTWPLREFFRRIFVVVAERGVLWRIQRKFLYVRRCEHEFDNKARALGAHDVFSAFALLATGQLLSIIFLFLEKAYYRKFTIFLR